MCLGVCVRDCVRMLHVLVNTITVADKLMKFSEHEHILTNNILKLAQAILKILITVCYFFYNIRTFCALCAQQLPFLFKKLGSFSNFLL